MSSLLVLLLIAIYLLTVYAFFDVLMKPNSSFKSIGQSKYVWLVLIFIVGAFAAIPYVLFVKPMVSKARK